MKKIEIIENIDSGKKNFHRLFCPLTSWIPPRECIWIHY